MSQALVTGGAGFIGSTLVRLLAERGYDVRVFDDLSSAGAGLLDGTGAEIVQGDVRDLDALVAAAQGCDAMFHLAAGAGVIESVEDPLANFDVNARGTVTALWAAHQAGVPAVRVLVLQRAAGRRRLPGQRGQADRAALALRGVARRSARRTARPSTAPTGSRRWRCGSPTRSGRARPTRAT